ncbi:hypothetical protein ACNAW0_03990 [Micromonospora sp. SL1-18]|uniref:hypothetical protein n=1 Tax=Micromonospora sp. SL1-18 TaxID=3399128 RepID=UPI003A4D7153
MTRTFRTKSMALLLGVALTSGLAACGGSADPEASAAGTSASSAQAGTGGDAAPASADAPVVVLKVAADAVLKEDYATLDQLAASPNARVVVSGKVVEATPVYQEQVAYTKLMVTVTKSSSNSVAVGSTVVVYRDGGQIPLSQVLPDLKSDQMAMLPASPPANAVVDFRFMGSEQSAVGDEIVAFLQPDPNPGRAGAYQLVSSVHGLLKLDRKSSTYHRLGDEKRAGYETSANTATAEAFTRRRS